MVDMGDWDSVPPFVGHDLGSGKRPTCKACRKRGWRDEMGLEECPGVLADVKPEQVSGEDGQKHQTFQSSDTGAFVPAPWAPN